jgi:CHAT domain-containing protein/tetratricopeptide (TPR) repeat protein
MDEGIPSKTDILLAYARVGQNIAALLFQSDAHKNAGDLPAALAAYDALIAALKQQLQIALLNNGYYPDSPFELPPIVDPLLNTILTQADVCEALADWDRAEALRNEAPLLAEKYLGASGVARVKQQAAAALLGQGRFNEALAALAEARDRFQEEGDPLQVANVTANVAGILEWLGDFERALAEVDRARQTLAPWISEGGVSREDVDRALRSGQLQEAQLRAKLLGTWLEMEQVQARINRYLGNHAEAARQFRQVKPQILPMAHPAIDYQLAAILIADGQYEQGLAYVARLEPAFRGLLRPKLAALLRIKAEALLGLGRPGEALGVLDDALADLSRYRDPHSLWRVQSLRARTLQALGSTDAALQAYADAAAAINNLRKAPLGYRLDSLYLQDKMPVFEAAIPLAARQDEAETCCRLMEMIKSRILTATLSIAPGDQPAGGGALDQQVDQLSRRIDALEYAGSREGWTSELERRRDALLAERAELMERIRFSDPRWRSLSEPIPFDLRATLDLLAQRDLAAITLFYRPRQIVAVLLKDGGCLTRALELTDETGAALDSYQYNLQAPQTQVARFDPSPGLGLFADHLVPPELLEAALQAAAVIVVPHGPLHLLPWAALTFEGQRLFQHCPVGIIPNLSCLLALQADLARRPRVALIGAPDYSAMPQWETLRFAAEELQTIKEIYSTPPGVIDELMVGHRATEGNFWRLAHHPDAMGSILHVSCHGTFATGHPMSSGLLLTDARVDATEIARRRLHYDEVILSACSTGYRPTEVQGVSLAGDDIVGLPGALLEAGARSVLVSIPPAREDAAMEFMTLYHENRADGNAPLQALQETQKGMLDNPLYPPHLWSGFTVYGCQ